MITTWLDAFYAIQPDSKTPAQSVSFGTSGHRGSSLAGSFNELHILAIAQAVADCRQHANITSPLFIGLDTHALSRPAWEVALQVLLANQVSVYVATDEGVTATPLLSRAILMHNAGREQGLADGLIITPSHNPPEDGGIKYNTPDDGPADSDVTDWIEARANQYLRDGCAAVQRVRLPDALALVEEYDYVVHYIAELDQVWI